MNRNLKHSLLALAASGLILGGGLVAAQATGDAQSTPSSEVQAAQADQSGRSLGRGLRGLPFRHLALGTTVELSFYDGNPETAGEALDTLETLTFTYGEDSEAAFAESFAAAREAAAYMTVEVGEQTRTVDLSDVELPTNGRGLLPRELAGRGFRGGSLADGGTISATFFDGDPEAGGQALETLSFTYGQDSEAGFADSFSSAAEDAAFVTVTTSPQSYTVDLSQASLRDGGQRGLGDGGPGERGGRGRR